MSGSLGVRTQNLPFFKALIDSRVLTWTRHSVTETDTCQALAREETDYVSKYEVGLTELSVNKGLTGG